MSIIYFRLHKPWDFSSGSLDIGNRLPYWKRSQLNRFVLNRIIALGGKRFAEFYAYHLAYCPETQQDADEQLFYHYLYELLTEDHERLKDISIVEYIKVKQKYLCRFSGSRCSMIEHLDIQTVVRLFGEYQIFKGYSPNYSPISPKKWCFLR